MGYGRQKGHKEVYRGWECQVDLLPKARLEIVVPDGRNNEVTETSLAAAGTGNIGDGKIFVYTGHEAIRIRNYDRGRRCAVKHVVTGRPASRPQPLSRR